MPCDVTALLSIPCCHLDRLPARHGGYYASKHIHTPLTVYISRLQPVHVLYCTCAGITTDSIQSDWHLQHTTNLCCDNYSIIICIPAEGCNQLTTITSPERWTWPLGKHPTVILEMPCKCRRMWARLQWPLAEVLLQAAIVGVATASALKKAPCSGAVWDVSTHWQAWVLGRSGTAGQWTWYMSCAMSLVIQPASSENA